MPEDAEKQSKHGELGGEQAGSWWWRSQGPGSVPGVCWVLGFWGTQCSADTHCYGNSACP